MKIAAVLLALSAIGCGGAIAASSRDATQSAVATLDDATSKKQLEDLATATVKAAKDEAFNVDTTARARALAQALAAELRAEVLGLKGQLLDASLRSQIRALIRAAIDEALGPVTSKELVALREDVFGAGLGQDIDNARPHVIAVADGVVADVQAQIAKASADVKTQADVEIAKYKSLAEVFAAVGLVLLVAVGLVVHELRVHRRELLAIIKEKS